MNKKVIAFISIFSFSLVLSIIPVNAIENGSDAVDNSVVVQIQMTFSNFSTTCSGALMAPRIVVTADHCINLVGESNKNNLIQSAKVAPAGAARDIQTSSYIKVTDFIFTPREGENGAVFLVLESALDLKLPVRIASASDIDNLQSNKSPIRFIGYGTTDKNQTVYKNSPQFAEGELFKDLENSHVHFRSNPGAPCAGDSGGPVIQELEKETLLIGLIQGPWYLDGKSFCPIETRNAQGVRQDNIYKYSVYIPLYTSDAVSDAKLAAEKVLATPAKISSNKVTGDYVSVMTDYKKLMIRLESLKRRYVNNTSLLAMEEKMLKIQISPGDNLSSAIYNIESINKKIDSSIKVWDQLYLTIIECVKGNTTKKVTAKNPKCPKGYKVKL